jgi:peptidoglycan hydrolase-like protein with peptidoglycan-binding domain
MDTIKQGTTQKGATFLLQELLREAGYAISVDGDFGPGTDRAVRDFQRKNKLEADGVVGPKSWMKFMLLFPGHFEKLAEKFLSQDDIDQVAEDLGVEPVAVKAVREVEAGGAGFRGERPKILFEGHIFWKQLQQRGIDPGRHETGNEDILYPRWTDAIRKYYRGDQYARLEKARTINEDAALESASWGLFQILGYHWKSLGYASIQEFVERMHKSEGEHLQAFARFLKANDLVKYLKALDWAKFARGYNGPAYKQNKYDEKLAAAYEKNK